MNSLREVIAALFHQKFYHGESMTCEWRCRPKRVPFPVGGKTHCALIAAHANDVQNKNETQRGDAKELDIINTKSSRTGLHNKMGLNLESEKLCGV